MELLGLFLFAYCGYVLAALYLLAGLPWMLYALTLKGLFRWSMLRQPWAIRYALFQWLLWPIAQIVAIHTVLTRNE